MQRLLYEMRLRVQDPNMLAAWRDYIYTDENLKFVHILECMNYLKISGSGGVVPPVYFEFGCHSGRTFSAAVRAARFLGLEKAEFFAFDSFEGLPPTDVKEDGAFITGTFATSRADFVRIVERDGGLKLDDQHVTQGFYNNSL